MAEDITGRRVAFLATDGVERVELDEPWRAVTAAGGSAVLVAPHDGAIRSFEHLDPSEERPQEQERLTPGPRDASTSRCSSATSCSGEGPPRVPTTPPAGDALDGLSTMLLRSA